jgi:hypothetical protein
MKQPGKRVGAILGGKGRTVEFLGYGVYDGDKPIDDDAAGWMADMLRANRDEGLWCDNPRITLDDGGHVWGCECWWGGEQSVLDKIRRWADSGHIIIRVDINEVRRHHTEQSEEKPTA